MFCNYCGFENPNNALFCSKCGKNISNDNSKNDENINKKIFNITIFRESQLYIINPAINISIGNNNRFSIENGETIKVPLEQGHYEIIFSQSLRKKILNIDLQKDIHIILKWNRLSGAIQTDIT